MKRARTRLEQWQVFQTVVDAGGFARAAQRLHRSQSAVSYAVHTLQRQLGIRLLEIEGRKARLTDIGAALLEHARRLVDDAWQLENLARELARGWEAEVRLTVDSAFPIDWLTEALQRFATAGKGTRVRLSEVILSGVDEALISGQADLAVGVSVPPNFLGEKLMDIEFIAVAHPDHLLHRLKRALTLADLKREIQVVISDSGTDIRRDMGWLGAEQKWHVTSLHTALATLSANLGFAWLPAHMIAEPVKTGKLKPLPLRQGKTHSHPLYLIYGQPHGAGPAVCLLADILKRVVRTRGTRQRR